jgi:hypothetical protein
VAARERAAQQAEERRLAAEAEARERASQAAREQREQREQRKRGLEAAFGDAFEEEAAARQRLAAEQAERAREQRRQAVESGQAAEEDAAEVERVLAAPEGDARAALGLPAVGARRGGAGAAVTAADAKKRYRALAVRLHPDKCAHPRAKDAFQRVGEAYRKLARELGAAGGGDEE